MNTAARRRLKGARMGHRGRPLRVYFSAPANSMLFYMQYSVLSRRQGSAAALASEDLAMLLAPPPAGGSR